MSCTKTEAWSCDACGVDLGGDPRARPRGIPGCPDFKPEQGVALVMTSGYNTSVPFDLCEGCFEKALDVVDPTKVLRDRLNETARKYHRARGATRD